METIDTWSTPFGTVTITKAGDTYTASVPCAFGRNSKSSTVLGEALEALLTDIARKAAWAKAEEINYERLARLPETDGEPRD